MELLNPMDDASFPAYTAAYTGTAGSTTAWPSGPQGVLVWSDQPCYVIVGEGVTATTANGTPIPPYVAVPFTVPSPNSGAPWRVSAIQVSTGGTIYCKPINIR